MLPKLTRMPPQAQFGARIKINPEKAARGAAIATASTAVPSASASGVVATGTAVAGSVLQSGGTGLISTGPQSSAAAPVLSALDKAGSATVAQWSVANPILGGLTQILAGAFLGGSGGSSSVRVSTKLKPPSFQ